MYIKQSNFVIWHFENVFFQHVLWHFFFKISIWTKTRSGQIGRKCSPPMMMNLEHFLVSSGWCIPHKLYGRLPVAPFVFFLLEYISFHDRCWPLTEALQHVSTCCSDSDGGGRAEGAHLEQLLGGAVRAEACEEVVHASCRTTGLISGLCRDREEWVLIWKSGHSLEGRKSSSALSAVHGGSVLHLIRLTCRWGIVIFTGWWLFCATFSDWKGLNVYVSEMFYHAVLQEHTRVGADTSQDIQLFGIGIQPEHCILDLCPDGDVTLTSIGNARWGVCSSACPQWTTSSESSPWAHSWGIFWSRFIDFYVKTMFISVCQNRIHVQSDGFPLLKLKIRLDLSVFSTGLVWMVP